MYRFRFLPSMLCVVGMQKVEYGGKHYHYECFICSTCRKPIGDNTFMPNGNLFNCMNCHNEHYAAKCGGCSKVRQLQLTCPAADN